MKTSLTFCFLVESRLLLLQVKVQRRQEALQVELEQCGEDMDKMAELLDEMEELNKNATDLDMTLLDRNIDKMMPELGFSPDDNDQLVAAYRCVPITFHHHQGICTCLLGLHNSSGSLLLQWELHVHVFLACMMIRLYAAVGMICSSGILSLEIFLFIMCSGDADHCARYTCVHVSHLPSAAMQQRAPEGFYFLVKRSLFFGVVFNLLIWVVDICTQFVRCTPCGAVVLGTALPNSMCMSVQWWVADAYVSWKDPPISARPAVAG